MNRCAERAVAADVAAVVVVVVGVCMMHVYVVHTQARKYENTRMCANDEERHSGICILWEKPENILWVALLWSAKKKTGKKYIYINRMWDERTFLLFPFIQLEFCFFSSSMNACSVLRQWIVPPHTRTSNLYLYYVILLLDGVLYILFVAYAHSKGTNSMCAKRNIFSVCAINRREREIEGERESQRQCWKS